MIVLFIGVGSNTTFIKRRIFELARQGIMVKVALNDKHTSGSGCTILPVFRSLNVKCLVSLLFHPSFIYRALMVWSDIPGISWLSKQKYIIRYHRFFTDKFDLIHIQWIEHASQYQWIRKLRKIPIVSSARGAMVTIYPLVKRNYLERLQSAFQISDRLHCVSNDILISCVKWGAAEEKCIVNYNGIDTDRFSPREERYEKTTSIISIGALMWRKGYLYQLQLIKKLINSGFDIKLRIVGDGPDREGLEYQANKLGIKNHIHFCGILSEQEIINELQKSDIYVSTSAAEGLSNAVMEAASCGLPVVAFDCEGMQEIILDGETGYIVDYGDIESLVIKISQLIQSKADHKMFSARAREHIVDNFKIEDKVSEMVNLYRNLIDERRQA